MCDTHASRSSPTPCIEFNIIGYNNTSLANSCTTYSAAPSMTWAPLDTAGSFLITGSQYQRLLSFPSPIVKATLSHYESWAASSPYNGELGPNDATKQSTVLFDVVAAALLLPSRGAWFDIVTIDVYVDGEGYTKRGQNEECGGVAEEAVGWKEGGEEALAAYVVDLLVEQ